MCDRHGRRTTHDGPSAVVSRCPYDECGWQTEVKKDYDDDPTAVETAEYRAVRHFDQEHCGRAKIRVRLERTIQVQPGDSLQSILDHDHDRVEEQIDGWDVAFAFGEYLEEPDGPEGDNGD